MLVILVPENEYAMGCFNQLAPGNVPGCNHTCMHRSVRMVCLRTLGKLQSKKHPLTACYLFSCVRGLHDSVAWCSLRAGLAFMVHTSEPAN